MCSKNDCLNYHEIYLYIHVNLTYIKLSSWNTLFFFLLFFFFWKQHTQVTINTLQSFLEGKNVTDIVQIWQREHLKWDVFGMRDFTVAYGVLCVGTGALLVRNF